MPPQPVEYFKTPRSAILGEMSEYPRSPAGAVEFVRSEEAAQNLPGPTIYGSTAITSGGYKRDSALSYRQIIDANNQTSGLLMGALVSAKGVVTGENTLVPTEIGKATWPDGRAWTDTDYMIFYFAYASGLSAAAASKLYESIAVPEYATILATANARENRDNSARWPSYRAFTDIALGKVSALTRTPGGQPFEPFSVMLQLVDVDLSLGCRSEKMYADYFGLDLLVPAIDQTDLAEADPLARELSALDSLQATVGVPASAVMPVASQLNATPVLP